MITTLLLATLVSADPWTKTDTILSFSLASEMIYDGANTRYNLLNGSVHENNPLMGKYPSAFRLWGVGTYTFGIFLGTAYLMPLKGRRILEVLCLLAESINLTAQIVSMIKDRSTGYPTSFQIAF